MTPTSFTFVPNAGFANPAGMYSLTVQFLDSSSTPTQSVGPMAFPLAPTLLDQVATVVSNAEGRLVTVTMSPDVREGQDVSLSLASFSAPAQPFTGNVGSLNFSSRPRSRAGRCWDVCRSTACRIRSSST